MTNLPLLCCDLRVKKSPIHGYGVFANQDIQPGETIEECYTLYLRPENNVVNDYAFESINGLAFPLGYGVIYNHSSEPNAECILYAAESLTIFKAKRLIKKGEEIFISYGDGWFSSRKLKHKELSIWLKARVLLSSMKASRRAVLVAGTIFASIFLMKHVIVYLFFLTNK